MSNDNTDDIMDSILEDFNEMNDDKTPLHRINKNLNRHPRHLIQDYIDNHFFLIDMPINVLLMIHANGFKIPQPQIQDGFDLMWPMFNEFDYEYTKIRMTVLHAIGVDFDEYLNDRSNAAGCHGKSNLDALIKYGYIENVYDALVTLNHISDKDYSSAIEKAFDKLTDEAA